MTEHKRYGREYTPDYIINNMLDLSGYSNSYILDKHIMDNSCGNGAILRQAIERYCSTALLNGLNTQDISDRLSRYIHGIDIEPNECDKCRRKLDMTARKYGINNVKWDIRCSNTLETHEFDNKMDFVIGNPPYIRIHNLSDSFDKTKFLFTQNGTTDMYMAFFEVGLKMLNKYGVLAYITPNSYFTSVAGRQMRDYFTSNNLLYSIVDFKHYQIFNAATYSAITVLSKNKSDNLTKYYHFNEIDKKCVYIKSITSDDYITYKGFVFEKPSVQLETTKTDNGIIVRNGYATLCDKVFINDFDFKSEYIIPVIKASKGIITQIIYPYDKNGQLFSEFSIMEDAALYNYLSKYNQFLIHRNIRNDTVWYSYGRNQAIKDTYTDKIAVSPYIRQGDIKITNAPSGTGVYSGFYITSKSIPFEKIIKQIYSDDFYRYISKIGKQKSGGYYMFSSKDMKIYLDYKFS